MTSAGEIFPVLATGVAGAAAFLSISAYGVANPASCLWGPVLSRGPAASASVALTFDDGPLPGTTDPILDTLGEFGVRSTFFVIGRHARRHPDLVRRMHDEGHVVANHSFNHRHTGMFRRYPYWLREIRRCDDLLEQIIGRRPAIFRPPMGCKHWHLMNAAADLGHSVVTWSRRAWDVRMTTAAAILGRLVEPARGGDVMLLHDGNDPCLKPQNRSGTREAVRPLIDQLRHRNLESVRLDDLLGIPAYHPVARPG